MTVPCLPGVRVLGAINASNKLLQRSFYWPELGTNVKRMDLDVSAVSGKREHGLWQVKSF
jgi:hypothetical protein